MIFWGYFTLMVLICMFMFKLNTSSESPLLNGLYVLFALLVISCFSFNLVITRDVLRYLPTILLSSSVLYRTFPKFKVQIQSLYLNFKNRSF